MREESQTGKSQQQCHKFLYSEELSGANYLPGSHPKRSKQTVVIPTSAQQGAFRVSLIPDITLRDMYHSRKAEETKASKFTNRGCLHYVCHPGKDRV